jgi:two-component system response regulator HydG
MKWPLKTSSAKILIYRINTVEIKLPPLRERGDDVILLAKHFANHYAEKNRKSVPEFDDSTLKKLKQHRWPGNIRELQHAVERAIILSEGNVLRPQDFTFSGLEDSVLPEAFLPFDISEQTMALSEVERSTIIKVIDKNKGNISRAAKELGITRAALYRRLSKHDI